MHTLQTVNFYIKHHNKRVYCNDDVLHHGDHKHMQQSSAPTYTTDTAIDASLIKCI